MNATVEQMEQFHLKESLAAYESAAANALGVEPYRFYDCNTLQFSDYSRYESSIFSEQDKRDYHAKYGKEMEEKAFQMGRQLIQDAQENISHKGM